MMSNFKRAYALLDKRQKRGLAVLLLMMLAVALLETLGIGLLMPYVGVVNSPDLITSNRYLHMLYQWLGAGSTRSFIIIVSVALILLFVFKNAAYVLQQYVQARQLLKLQLNIESRLMKSYLSREYLFFTSKNPAELYQSIRNVSGIISLVYTPALNIVTEVFVLTLIGALLIAIQPWVTLAAAGVSTALVLSIFRFTRKRATRYGVEGNQNMIEMNKWMYQSFGGIKEVKILSRESFFLDRSMLYSEKSAWVGMKAAMLSAVTRPLIETVWFSLTVLLVLVAISLGKDGSALLPVIALLAAAAMRIMPALNRILNATISIRQATCHVEAVAAELGQIGSVQAVAAAAFAPPQMPIEFHNNICFVDVVFRYPGEDEPVLRNLSFTIRKGESIAFVGPSGAGKTTVVDLLLGLLEPQRGSIVVDDVPLSGANTASWRRNFGYVPQTIYLSDDTVRNNIAFGQVANEIDASRVNEVVAQAQLSEVLNRLPNGLDTVVGDRGARLSGGQRQRIGIARALYHAPPILVLDEATSALDNETEREITRAIRTLSGNKTVILIAHRLSTITHCDQIVFLVEGAVRAMGTYEGLMRDCEDFRRFATGTSI